MITTLVIVSTLGTLYYSIPVDAAKHKIFDQEFNDTFAQEIGRLNKGDSLFLNGVVGGFLDQDIDPADLYQVVVMKPQTVVLSLDSNQPTTQLRVWTDKNRDRQITAGEQIMVYKPARETAIATFQPGAYIIEVNDGIPRREANYSVEIASIQ
ncbi:hypothetical protein [Leptothermofonsia sp. ETS-13]|uniref:hypothetical protein n=1 Tax=Leptothermofonsia sp. ETS-13 TaxID=3035696 RepID=UPI003BA1C9F9